MFDFNYMLEVLVKVASKIGVTLQITLIATALALVLGFLLAVVSYFKVPVLYQVSRVFISFMRGTPVLAQLYFFYYGLAIYSVFIRDMAPVAAVSIILSLSTGAFMSESIRGALLSVDKGQIEAARSLGLSEMQIVRYIIFPQAIRIALPPLFNDIINLIKASSLAFAIGITDIMAEAKIQGSKTARYFEAYAAAMIIYWVLIICLEAINKMIEKRCQIKV